MKFILGRFWLLFYSLIRLVFFVQSETRDERDGHFSIHFT
jgi:hypothetical protein